MAGLKYHALAEPVENRLSFLHRTCRGDQPRLQNDAISHQTDRNMMRRIFHNQTIAAKKRDLAVQRPEVSVHGCGLAVKGARTYLTPRVASGDQAPRPVIPDGLGAAVCR